MYYVLQLLAAVLCTGTLSNFLTRAGRYKGWYYCHCSAYVREGLVGLVTMVISVLKEN